MNEQFDKIITDILMIADTKNAHTHAQKKAAVLKLISMFPTIRIVYNRTQNHFYILLSQSFCLHACNIHVGRADGAYMHIAVLPPGQ